MAQNRRIWSQYSDWFICSASLGRCDRLQQRRRLAHRWRHSRASWIHRTQGYQRLRWCHDLVTISIRWNRKALSCGSFWSHSEKERTKHYSPAEAVGIFSTYGRRLKINPLTDSLLPVIKEGIISPKLCNDITIYSKFCGIGYILREKVQ